MDKKTPRNRFRASFMYIFLFLYTYCLVIGIMFAARGGHLEILKEYFENGHPVTTCSDGYDSTVVMHAAEV